MGPCIIMLQHEVMVMDEWNHNGPQDLVTVSLCIQNAINKMHLYSLYITYAFLYHNPTATMGHSIHNIDISKPLTHLSDLTLTSTGSPQGCVLSPLLYILYTNDCRSVTENRYFVKFADDTVIVSLLNNEET